MIVEAPGGAWDLGYGYDEYAPEEGYLLSGKDPFSTFGEELTVWGGSDPGGGVVPGASVSTSDIVRSRDAGIPYPSNPINTVPDYVSPDSERSSLNNLFKGVIDTFGKTAVMLAGTIGAQALSRTVPGRPTSSKTHPGSPVGLPARPLVLPSFLGGGSFSAPSGSSLFLILAATLGAILLFRFARR